MCTLVWLLSFCDHCSLLYGLYAALPVQSARGWRWMGLALMRQALVVFHSRLNRRQEIGMATAVAVTLTRACTARRHRTRRRRVSDTRVCLLFETSGVSDGSRAWSSLIAVWCVKLDCPCWCWCCLCTVLALQRQVNSTRAKSTSMPCRRRRRRRRRQSVVKARRCRRPIARPVLALVETAVHRPADAAAAPGDR